jgi:hypothetical protein
MDKWRDENDSRIETAKEPDEENDEDCKSGKPPDAEH